MLLLHTIRHFLQSRAPEKHLVNEDDEPTDAQKKKLDEGYLQRAPYCLNQADRMDQRNRVSWINKGYLMLHRHELDEGLQQFETVLSTRPTPIPALLGKGQIHMKKMEWRKGVKTHQLLLQLTSQDTQPLHISTHVHGTIRAAIGICFHRQGFLDEAEYAFKRALALDHQNLDGFVGLATVHLQRASKQTDPEKAQDISDEGIRLLERAFELMMTRQKNYQKAIEVEVLRQEQLDNSLEDQEVPSKRRSFGACANAPHKPPHTCFAAR